MQEKTDLLRCKRRLSKSLTLPVFVLLVLMHAMSPAQAASWLDDSRRALREAASPLVHRYRAWQADLQIDSNIRIAVPGKSALPPLQATLYRPASKLAGPLPAVLVMLPYNRHRYGEALRAGIEFGRAGFAVLSLDLRGYESDALADGLTSARQIPWAGVQEDASAVLDWIINQPWSNGRVGSFGCSALGETQFALARARHPAHQAMLVAGAGGALGSVDNRYGYFGVFEGGILELASSYGWLASRGWLQAPYKRDAFSSPDNPLPTLSRLPVADLIPGTDNAWHFLTRTPLDSPAWRALGYVSDQDELTTPLLTINTWNDLTLSDSIVLHQSAKSPHKQLILAPGGHCQHESGPAPYGDASHWQALYNSWFTRWLKPATATEAATKPPANGGQSVYYRIPGAEQWQQSTQWPPPSATEYWHLNSAGNAHSVRGDGELIRSDSAARPDQASPAKPGYVSWLADPADPVPSRGGPVCCTGTPAISAGPANQADVEARDDVLVFTSAPFEKASRYAGPVTAELFVASQTPDFDIVVRVTDVAPDGVSTNIQEGAQRVSVAQRGQARSLSGGEIVQGEVFPLTVNARQMAHRFEVGHRLRLHIAASSFPRLVRNLQTGEPNRLGTTTQKGEHQVNFSREYPSRLILHRLTD